MKRKKRNPVPKAAIKIGAKAGAKIGVKAGAKAGAKAVPFLGEALMALDAAPVLLEGTATNYSEAGRSAKQAFQEARGKHYRQAIGTTARAGGKLVASQVRTLARTAGAALASKEVADSLLQRTPQLRKNGPTLDRPTYPFAEKEEHYARYTDAELAYALADAKQAFEQEERLARAGHWLAQHGWYADDVHTIAAEIRKRRAPRRNRANPTAWQKEMRKTSAPKQSKFEVLSVEKVREGTFRLHLDLGADGAFPVTVYPDGYMQSGTGRVTQALQAKIESWARKNAKLFQTNPRRKTAKRAKGRSR